MPPVDQANQDAVFGALRRNAQHNAQLQEQLNKLEGFLTGMMNVPKFIEDIPGKRSPYFETIEIEFSAGSTAKREGTAPISTDGPFVCTGLHLAFQHTDGPYAGIWGPPTTMDTRLIVDDTLTTNGLLGIFDQPHVGSFTIEISVHGSDRLWQSAPVPSSLYSPQAGGAYILPASSLIGRNATIRLAATPDIAFSVLQTVGQEPELVNVATRLVGVFLGYKIVQGATYQP
jgi:hypothetical protein